MWSAAGGMWSACSMAVKLMNREGATGHTPPSAGKQQARARESKKDKKVQVLEFSSPLHSA